MSKITTEVEAAVVVDLAIQAVVQTIGHRHINLSKQMLAKKRALESYQNHLASKAVDKANNTDVDVKADAKADAALQAGSNKSKFSF